ncbi:MAG: MarR family transcriptional regulator, partial [Propionicimonas sp.]|nr:MarR family transcriptional regulator [Propionicimonas sp.]
MIAIFKAMVASFGGRRELVAGATTPVWYSCTRKNMRDEDCNLREDDAPADRLRAWSGAVQRAAAPQVLERELQATAALSLAEFGTLVALATADGASMRVGEIATRTALTISRVSRAISSLEARQLVQRSPCATDGRGVETILTPAGRTLLESLDLDAELQAATRTAEPVPASAEQRREAVVPPVVGGVDAGQVFDDLIRVETVLWADAADAVTRHAGITLPEYEVLRVIDRLGSCGVKDVADGLRISPSGAGKIATRVEDRGHITRTVDPRDARAATLTLTGTGRSVLDIAAELVRTRAAAALTRVLG